MAKDFQLIFSKKNSSTGYNDCPAGIYDVFQDDLEELGPSDPYWNVQNPDENITSNINKEDTEENSGDSSANTAKTPEVDGIPESVRDLLKLLVNRASLNESECNKTECVTNPTNEANESWSSSMATPSKNKSMFSDVNNSTLISFKLESSMATPSKDKSMFSDVNNSTLISFKLESSMATPSKDKSMISDVNNSTLISFKPETSDLDNVPESKNVDPGISLISLHQNKQVNDCESNDSGSFYGFDAAACGASFNSVIEINSILNDKRQFTIYNSAKVSYANDFENLLLLSDVASDKKDLVENSEHIDTVAEQDNSVLDFSVNSVIIDEDIKENEAVFMKSTPIKQYSLGNDCNEQVYHQIDEIKLNSDSTDVFMKEKDVSPDLEILGNDKLFLNKEEFNFSSTTPTNSAIRLTNFEDKKGEKIDSQTDDDYDFELGTLFQMKDSSSDRLVLNPLPEISNTENIKDTCDMDTVILSGNNVTSMILASSYKQEEMSTSNNLRKSEEVSMHDRSLDTKGTLMEPEYVSKVLDILCSPIASTGISRKKYVEELKKKNEISPGLNNVEVEINELHDDNETISEESRSTEVRKISTEVSHNAESDPEEVTFLNESVNVIEREELLVINVKENEFYDKKHQEMDKSHHSPDPSKTKVRNLLLVEEPESLKPKNVCSKELFFDPDERKITEHMTKPENNLPSNEGDRASAPHLEVFKEEILSSCIKSSNMDDCVVKIEPEDDCHSQPNLYGSQDYLSYSVLEEVCKATEELAYCSKVKNECILDDSENEIEIVGSCIKVDSGKSPILESKMAILNNKGMKNGTENTELCIKYKKNEDNIVSVSNPSLNIKSSQSDIIVVNIDSDNEVVCKNENDLEQNLRKKLLFMAPECITLDDDAEWDEEFQFHDEIEKDSQINNSDIAKSDPKAMDTQQIPQIPAAKEPISLPCNTGVKTQTDSTRFVYPKKGKRISHLIPIKIKPEDLMASAIALEKCNNISCNQSKSACQLKAKSLVSFDKLVNSTVKEVKKQSDNISSDTYDISLINADNSILNKNSDDKIMDHNKIICSDSVTIKPSPGVGSKKKETVRATHTSIKNDSICQDIAIEVVVDNIKNQNEIQESGGKKNCDLVCENQNERCASPVLLKKKKKQKSFSRSNKYLNEKSSMIIKDGLHYGSPSKLSQLTDLKVVPNQNENQSQITLAQDVQENCSKITSFPKEPEDVEDTNFDDLKTFVDYELILKSSKESEHIDIFIKNSKIDTEICKKNSMIEKHPSLKVNSAAFPVYLKQALCEADKDLFEESKTGKQKLKNYPVNCRDNSTENKTTLEIEKTSITSGSSTPVTVLQSVFSSTASGKKLDSSDKSQLQTRKGELIDECSTPIRVTNSVGFVTASGKKVAISEKSLLQAKKLFLNESNEVGMDGNCLKDSETILSNMGLSEITYPSTTGKCYDSINITAITSINSSTECRKSIITKRESIDDSSTPVRAPNSVGFATASGKKVAVSEKSLLQAKKLFMNETNEVGNDDQGLKDTETILSTVDLLVNAYPSTSGNESKNTTPITSIKKSAESIKTSIAKRKPINDSSTPARAPGLTGFSTASGKKVAISEKSLLQAKKLFLNECNEVSNDNQGLKDTETILSNMGLSESAYPSTSSNELNRATPITRVKKSAERAKTSTSKREPISGSTPASRPPGLVGFATASGKKVAVTEKSLLQAKKLFLNESNEVSNNNQEGLKDSETILSNVDLLENAYHSTNGNESNNHTPITSIKKSAKITKTSYTKREPIDESSTPARAPGLVGFSTASGKKVAISEKSLLQAKRLFLNETNEVGMDGKCLKDTETVLSNMGVSEATYPSTKGKVNGSTNVTDVNVIKKLAQSTETSITKRNAIDDSSTPARAPGLVCFATASGKKVAISEKSLLKAKGLFLNESNEVGMDGKGLKDTETILSNMKSKDMAFPSPRRVNKELNTDLASYIKRSNDCGKINISNIESADESLTPVKDLHPVCYPTSCGKTLTASEKSQEEKRDFLKQSNNNNTEYVSFLKNVQEISSNKSLSEVRKLAPHADFSGKMKPFNSPAISTKTSPEIKKSIITKRESIDDSSTPVRAPNSVGFATASGKKVAVSEKSLLQAKKLFMNETNEVGNGNQGLKDTETILSTVDLLVNAYPSTSGNESKNTTPITSIKKSAESIKTSIAKRKPINDSSTPARAPGLTGFSTASGKKVAISEKSLLQAKKLFLNECNEVSNDNQGLKDTETILSNMGLSESAYPSTSSNELNRATPITRVKKSAERAKTSTSKREPISGSTPASRPPGLVGFATASGKKVAVTEKSLLQAKRLFMNDPNEVGKDEQDCNNHDFKNISYPQDTEITSSNMVFLDQGNLSSDIEGPAIKESCNVPVTGLNRSVEYRKPSILCKESKGQPLSPLSSHQKGVFSMANEKEVGVPDISLLPANKIFHDDSNLDDTKRINSSTYGISENIAILSNISTYPKQYSVTLTHKNVNTSSNSKDKYSLSLKHGESNFQSEVESVNSVSNKKQVNVRQMVNSTQEFLFPESQGDNYIIAVDPKLLKSKDNIPPSPPSSPVLITSNRRKRSRQNVSTSRKKCGNDYSKKSKTDSCATPPSNSVSNCSQSSLSSTAKIDFPARITEDELWDNDLAEFSCLGFQLDLAEASNFSKGSNMEFDNWSEARKRQNVVISSKINVQPHIGRHLQERICRRKFFKKSLRDLVQGRRPGRYTKVQLRKHNLRENALNVTSNNAAEFKFQLKDHFSFKEMIGSKLDGILIEDGIRLIPDQKGLFGVVEAEAALLAAPGVDPKLLPQGGWCQNHYRWIVWKLASSERSFPKELGGRYLTPANVMRQLKYRWDREIDRGERSAIRKILEKDDTSSKRMVLCVASIQKPGPISSSKKLELDLLAETIKLDLTDGWYGIQGIIDAEMAALIQNGKVSVGTKLVTSGAELINSPPNGCHPLEPPASKAGIRLSTNSTRRARWDVKLGYMCKSPGPLPVTIRSLLPGGNTVSLLKNVLLARTYPIVNVEKTSDGRKIIRSQRAEAKAAANHERQRQIWLEDIYSQVSAEIQKEEDEEVKNRQQRKRKISLQFEANKSSKRPRRSLGTYEVNLDPRKLSCSLSGTIPPEELLKYIEESGDPSGLQSMLTSSQLNTLAAYKQDARERRHRELEDRVRQRLKEEEEKLASGNLNSSDGSKKNLKRMKRDVVALFKVRLVDADKPVPSKSAVLTIWRPSEEVADIFSKEGVILNIYGVTANGIRSGFLQLSSNRQTKYKLKQPSLRSASNLLDAFPTLKRVIIHQGFDDYSSYQGPGASYSPPFGEIDLVALVLKVGVEPNKEKGQGFQNVYFVGSDGSLMSIAFWGGIQEFAVEDIIQPGAVVVATNLQWRRNHGLCRIPTVHAVETSTFTRYPSEERLTMALKKFQNEFKNEIQSDENRSAFLESCNEKLDLLIGSNRKEENKVASLVKKSIAVDSGPSSGALIEKCFPVNPSVLSRMKKLQMYEGNAEISLPVQHLRKSPAVMRAFRPPVKSTSPKPSLGLENKGTHSDNDSSPMSLNSDVP